MTLGQKLYYFMSVDEPYQKHECEAIYFMDSMWRQQNVMYMADGRIFLHNCVPQIFLTSAICVSLNRKCRNKIGRGEAFSPWNINFILPSIKVHDIDKTFIDLENVKKH